MPTGNVPFLLPCRTLWIGPLVRTYGLPASAQVGLPGNFRTVASAALPGNGWAVAVDLIVASKCFGVATSYLVVIGDTLPPVVRQCGGPVWLARRKLWVRTVYRAT